MERSITKQPVTTNKAIAIWLYICCVMILVMVVVGGSTRLTGSGLSMVDWHPIHGSIPPLNQQEWNEEFNNYKQSPEYIHINYDMSLVEFKKIFAFEYIHRILGRLTGLVFFFPFMVFLVRRQLSPSLTIRLGYIFTLGALQGLIGWYMVKSGLVDTPHVSQYRLTLHLAMATLLLGLMVWTALTLQHPPTSQPNKSLARMPMLFTTMIFCQITSGAFVAGLKAGLIYNTFPLMGEYIIPPDAFYLTPWYVNITENSTLVQFIHRCFALVITGIIMGYWYLYCYKSTIFTKKITLIFHIFVSTLLIQISLGISTLLLKVPIILGVTHQLVALILFTISLYLLHNVLYSASQRNDRISSKI